MIQKKRVLANFMFFFVLTALFQVTFSEEISIGQGRYVNITLINDKQIEVNIKSLFPGWVGIGFGESMINTDMNVVLLQKNGESCSIHDMYSKRHEVPKYDRELGGIDNLLKKACYLNKTGDVLTYNAKYTRDLNTGDIFDKELKKDTNISFIASWGDRDDGELPKYHGYNNYYRSYFAIDSKTMKVIWKLENSDEWFYYLHGILLSICWTVLVCLGIITARHLKYKPNWVMYHRLFNGSASFVTVILASWAIIITLYKPISEYSHVKSSLPIDLHNAHKITGIIMLVFVLLQAIGGNFLYYLIVSTNKFLNTQDKLNIKSFHKYIGYGIYCLTKINVLIGYTIFIPKYLAVPVLMIVSDVILLILIEFYFRKINNFRYLHQYEERKTKLFEITAARESFLKYKVKAKKENQADNTMISEKADKDDAVLNQSPTEILSNIEDKGAEKSNWGLTYYTKEDLENLRTNNKKVVLYENFLVDIEEWINYHPGGQIHLEKSLYTDIGKMLNGGSSVSGDFQPYEHSFHAQSSVLDKAFGVLKDESLLIINGANKEPENMRQGLTPDHSLQLYEVYQLIGKREVAHEVYEVQLKPSLRDPKTKALFSKGLIGHQWIGKEFCVISKAFNKSKYFPVCLALNPNIHSLIKMNLSNIEAIEQNLPTNNVTLPEDKHFSDSLELYVRKSHRDTSNMSTYLSEYEPHDFNTNFVDFLPGYDDLVVRGPLGLGLDLEENLSGSYFIFAAGAEVLRILDFIAYISRLLTYRALLSLTRKSIGEKLGKWEPSPEQYVDIEVEEEDEEEIEIEVDDVEDVAVNEKDEAYDEEDEGLTGGNQLELGDFLEAPSQSPKKKKKKEEDVKSKKSEAGKSEKPKQGEEDIKVKEPEKPAKKKIVKRMVKVVKVTTKSVFYKDLNKFKSPEQIAEIKEKLKEKEEERKLKEREVLNFRVKPKTVVVEEEDEKEIVKKGAGLNEEDDEDNLLKEDLEGVFDGLSKEENFIFPYERESLSKIDKNFNLTFFVSFANPESAIYLDICNKMQEIDRKYNLNLFKFIPRISSIHERWSGLIRNEIEPKLDTISRVILCGTVGHNESMREKVLECGVQEGKLSII